MKKFNNLEEAILNAIATMETKSVNDVKIIVKHYDYSNNVDMTIKLSCSTIIDLYDRYAYSRESSIEQFVRNRHTHELFDCGKYTIIDENNIRLETFREEKDGAYALGKINLVMDVLNWCPILTSSMYEITIKEEQKHKTLKIKGGGVAAKL